MILGKGYCSALQKQLTKLNATSVARRVILQETAGQRRQFHHINHPSIKISQFPSAQTRTKVDFKAKYNKVKAKLAPLSSSASAFKSSMVNNKGLITEAYEWDVEEVSSDDNDMVEVKLLMALAEDNDVISKKGAKNGEWVKISMRKYDIRKPIWYMDSGCSRHITGVKSYLHKYVEQPGPKVFADISTCTTKGYGSIKCNGIVFIKESTLLWRFIRVVHYTSGLSFLTTVCLIRQRTNFTSWQQRIRLYFRGKENGVNILKSIDEGPFQMGTFRETIAEGEEGALHLGPERARVYSDLLPEDKKRFVTVVKLNRGLKESNYDQLYSYLKQQEAHANENKMMLQRFTQHPVDPLAVMSNVSPPQYSSHSSTTPLSTHVPPVTYQPYFVDNT
nr:retrovirus-related Pol polyprotein from transposon TNT 1-94 [Tanacetum cinerariifolium]